MASSPSGPACKPGCTTSRRSWGWRCDSRKRTRAETYNQPWLLDDNTTGLPRLDEIRKGFAVAMNQAIEAMWASKLGLKSYDASLVDELH
jgi:hypothetical protein